MQLFETLLSSVIGLFVLAIATQGRLNRHRFKLFCAASCVFVAHLALEIPRWQMGTTYFVGVVSALALLRTAVSHVVVRVAGLVFAFLLLANSVFLTAQLPIVQLPVPSGPYRVGTTEYCLTDPSRVEAFAGDGSTKRELFVEVWYPAEEPARLPPSKTMWSELYRGTTDQVSVFMGYMRGIPTHSYPDIAPDRSGGPFPLIIFNHGLQMFTAQNTILMEHLASHGYVVVSIGHPYESLRVNLSHAGTALPPFITSWAKFQEAMEWIEKSSGPVNDAIDRIETLQTRAERAELMLAAIDGASMNDTVDVWVKDSQFVLAELVSANGVHHPFQGCVDYRRVAAMGMSVGGAVAAELCKSDDRFTAGINVDGLAYGSQRREPLPAPFMMLYSDDGVGVNDFLLLQSTADYYEFHVSKSRHSDFTDFNIAWPIMRTAGQLGELSGQRMNEILNRTTLAFMDRYLKRLDVDVPTRQQIPEFVETVKRAAS